MIFKVFTDGSSFNGVGGCAAVYVEGPLKGFVETERIESNCTNIRAECLAIIMALEAALETPEWERLEIYTDSHFWKDMLEKYMPVWSAKKFETMKNPDLTAKIWALWQSIEKPKKIVFVYAHNKNGWKTSEDPYEQWCYLNNHKADKIASEARCEK